VALNDWMKSSAELRRFAMTQTSTISMPSRA